MEIIGYMSVLYRDNGKEHGNYQLGVPVMLKVLFFFFFFFSE